MKKRKSEDETMEESELIHTQDFDPTGEAAAQEDYDVDFSGKLGPDYHVNASADAVRLLVGREIVLSVPKGELKEAYRAVDYKTIIDMLTIFKKEGVDAWVNKFKIA